MRVSQSRAIGWCPMQLELRGSESIVRSRQHRAMLGIVGDAVPPILLAIIEHGPHRHRPQPCRRPIAPKLSLGREGFYPPSMRQ